MPRFVSAFAARHLCGCYTGTYQVPHIQLRFRVSNFSRNGAKRDHEAFQYPEGISVSGESYFWTS
jgi:hypothetical protein